MSLITTVNLALLHNLTVQLKVIFKSLTVFRNRCPTFHVTIILQSKGNSAFVANHAAICDIDCCDQIDKQLDDVIVWIPSITTHLTKISNQTNNRGQKTAN